MSRWITIEAAELAVKALEEENARLKAENERLTSDLQMEKENEDRLMREWQKANNEIYNLQTKVVALVDDQTRLKAEVERLRAFATRTIIPNEELQAQVERLTKAGDHLWAFAHSCVVLGVCPKTAQEKINIWHAAKGVQS